MEHYSRLDHDNQEKRPCRLSLYRMEELQMQGSYEALRDFARSRKADIREYRPEMEAQLQDAIFRIYFQERDSTHLGSLFNLLVIIRKPPPAWTPL
ncbi:MAG: hypothetical protein H6559_34210 [Lewinellaceae bacterium]|nr:hypothetical protein [Lewinellaceae bacterium]